MRKTVCCFVLLVLVANSGVLANRSLKETTSATASAVSNGGSAKAASAAYGPGANVNTRVVANDGANVKAKTIGVAENGAKVNVNTLAAGSGRGAGSSTTTIVKSDKDVDVGRYIARVSNGENVITLANFLAIEFTTRTNDRVVKGFREGLAKPDQGGRLFYKALEEFVKLQGCEVCRRIFQGRELSFLPLNLPPVFYQCVYKRCSNYKTSAGCCSSTQFKHKQCNCNGGRCLWGQPAKQGPFLKYWNCQQCGEKIPYCVCY